ncbi:MAG: rRNA maturation RNase YbeY [Candidatus Cloacimonetes bacterium]|jgi:probable rRNA maturation factor|nr:rRNA maturation RNase YbeY [Candidatus Cloacimonadota bacterium]MDY0299447.1 rRNA maturation RNase YbeY [Candidatus Cloacimonadaceae bacterium]MCB5278454.1 rRNA maturation RNase YbeY [Candidatus Cloacimonadota bacterium]MCK9332698.1 rRNA maturation RNase YbeY [Candidatus Cloacimonadota bacterium]MDD2210029.1 rRNA maturation RNase YbeY [Candidatus Cloacimonadota bacterium]
MTEIEIQGDLPLGITKEQIEPFAHRILSSEAPGIKFEISILCTNSEDMRKYNHFYRGVDNNTDALSFKGESLILEGVETQFCDIIIDTKQVFKQKGKNTFNEEFWQVLIHALLHLAGFDHIRTSDKEKMEDAEENYRKQIPEGLA